MSEIKEFDGPPISFFMDGKDHYIHQTYEVEICDYEGDSPPVVVWRTRPRLIAVDGKLKLSGRLVCLTGDDAEEIAIRASAPDYMEKFHEDLG